ncbi:MAG TPA: acyl-CoA dehydrogenase [Chryseosolibacter sp.]|nr:acyl-CoA dehydrogenase [Chryseosolibacter sp.]
MLGSKTLNDNPDLFVFLPLLYVVWSDALLTPGEISTVDRLIEKQGWLSKEEKEFLRTKIDPADNPSPDELHRWLDEIRKVVSPPSVTAQSLTDIGLKLAALHAPNGSSQRLENARVMLLEAESALGLIPNETSYFFQPGTRATITQQQTTRYTFDVTKLGNLLDGEHADIIARVKKLLADPVFKYVDPGNLADYRSQVLQWCRHLAQQGLGAIAYPRTSGGKEDMGAYFAVIETLSYHDLSLVVKFGVQFGLFGMSIYFLGTEKHHTKYLRDIGTLALPGCFAMTETGHGSNVRGLETTATYDHTRRSFIINTPGPNAEKEFIGNAALHGRMATVFAKLLIEGKDYGVTAFLVPLRDEDGRNLPGIAIADCGRKMGLNGVDNGKISFDSVVIPYDNMLDRFARISADGKFESPIASDNRRFFTMLGTLVGGRIGIPRSALAAAKTGLTIALRYGDQRKQFGPEGATEIPILNYRTHQRRLMPLLANAYAIHFSLQYLTKRFLARTEHDIQEIEALAAGLKAFATWNTTRTLQECRECCGGKGYLSENRIDALKNDTEIYTTFEGDNTVLMQLVAKSRLTEFKQEFANMNLFGILNYIADQAKTTITEKNPVAVRRTDEEHLLDLDFHLSAFKYRERDILTSAARRLKRHIDDGMDSFDAFNVVQHHLVQVAFAFVERVVLEQFILQVSETADEGCKTILTKLCQLFALSQIENNKAWYLENGYMEGVKTKAIRKLLNQLCWEIRKEAVPLVNAFNIPDHLLSAPIATAIRGK